MTKSAQLHTEAAEHEAWADHWASRAAEFYGHAEYCRRIGDEDQAAVSLIRARAAEQSEERALFRAASARHAARQLERAQALMEIGRAA